MFNRFKYYIVGLFIIITIGSAFLIPLINVNYDVTTYLPSDSSTSIALQTLDEEFGKNGYLQIMIENIDEINMPAIARDMRIENVKNIEMKYNNGNGLFQIALEKSDYDETSQNIIEELEEYLEGENYTYYMNGQAYTTYNYNAMIQEQIPKIILCLIPIILLILFLTTSSFFEPLLFVLMVGVSIILNMGTNAILPSVSYMTHAIGAVLQFAICMDYSIILLHRYRDCRDKGSSPNEAMAKAWKSSLIPIIASSLTTIAGFVAIMFMQYRIGLDIGLVLSKGVVFTLSTVIFLLPCLILISDKVLEKTRHRNLFKNIKGVYYIVNKTKFVLPFIILVLIGFGAYFQSTNSFVYGDNAFSNEGAVMTLNNQKIEESFGINSQTVILLDKSVNTNELITELKGLSSNKNYITASMSLDYQMSVDEVYQQFKGYGATVEDLTSLIAIIDNTKNTVSLNEILNFLPLLSKFDTEYTAIEIYPLISRFISISQGDLASMYSLMGVTKTSIASIAVFFQGEKTPAEMISIFNGQIESATINGAYYQLSKEKMSIIEFLTYFSTSVKTPYDSATMAQVLGVTSEETVNLYTMLGSTSLSIEGIVNGFSALHTSAEMKSILSSFAPNLIDSVYTTLGDIGMLEEGKTSIAEFIPFIRTNYSSYLNPTNIATLDAFVSQINTINNYEVQIAYLNNMTQTLSSFSGFDISILDSYANVDASLISDEFLSPNYQRAILNVELPEESDASFAYYEKFMTKVYEYDEDAKIIGATVSVMNIKEISNNDYIVTTILSIALVFIIIALSFKSISLPIILVALIQGAIFINMAIPALLGENMLFIGYLIVSCIQLGATIDYGILLSNRYVFNRKTHDKKESLRIALEESITSIITSAMILCIAGLLLCVISEVPIIALFGRLIGIGAIISTVLVLVGLPQLLYIFDKFIKKTTIKSEFVD